MIFHRSSLDGVLKLDNIYRKTIMPTFAEEFQAQLVTYLERPDIQEKIQTALDGQGGKLTRLFEGIKISDEAKKETYKKANKASSKGMYKLIMEEVIQASKALLSPDMNDLNDKIKPFFNITDENKDILIDNLLQGFGILISINLSDEIDSKLGFISKFNPETNGKSSISLLSPDGKATAEQQKQKDILIDRIIKPFHAIMPEITKSNMVLYKAEKLLDQIKHFIFSIFHNESKSLKSRADNLKDISNIVIRSIIKSEIIKSQNQETLDAMDKISNRLEEISMKLETEPPGKFIFELNTICHKIEDAIDKELVSFDTKEKQSIYQKIFNKISSLFSDSKLSDVQLAQKLMLRDPILKEKLSLLKAKNQAIKAEKTEKEPEITSEQINNIKP